MSIKLALAGDTMLGRGVVERLMAAPPEALFAPELVDRQRGPTSSLYDLGDFIDDYAVDPVLRKRSRTAVAGHAGFERAGQAGGGPDVP